MKDKPVVMYLVELKKREDAKQGVVMFVYNDKAQAEEKAASGRWVLRALNSKAVINVLAVPEGIRIYDDEKPTKKPKEDYLQGNRY